jgi:NADH:ubiquinone oxidoreductase subunit 4 (subunit M)
LYCGSICVMVRNRVVVSFFADLDWVVIDNGNIVFVLLLVILFPLIDWIAGFESKTMNYSLIFFLIFFDLFLCFVLRDWLSFFICYESLILLLFFLLFLFTFSYYRIRSAFFLFLFSIFGSITFIISLLIVILSQLLISSLFILFPFFIKIPSFPFFYWLPEIHCEVNSSISLFLAGLLLKLGVFFIFVCSFFFFNGCSYRILFLFSIFWFKEDYCFFFDLTFESYSCFYLLIEFYRMFMWDYYFYFSWFLFSRFIFIWWVFNKQNLFQIFRLLFLYWLYVSWGFIILFTM